MKKLNKVQKKSVKKGGNGKGHYPVEWTRNGKGAALPPKKMTKKDKND